MGFSISVKAVCMKYLVVYIAVFNKMGFGISVKAVCMKYLVVYCHSFGQHSSPFLSLDTQSPGGNVMAFLHLH